MRSILLRPLAVLVFLAMSGRAQTVLHTFTGDSQGDSFGVAVAGPGDVDGDGFGDVIAGAPTADNQGSDSGMARVFSGATGAVLFSFNGDSQGDWFGFSVGSPGDVNADGRADLLIGAPRDDANGSDSGTAFVLSGMNGSVLFTFHGDQAGDNFGHAVAGVGDFDADGRPDFAVGAPLATVSGSRRGRVRVYSGLDASILDSFVGSDSDGQFGAAIAGSGDVDGDGLPDILIGAPFEESGGEQTGRAHVYSGSTSNQLFAFNGADKDEQFGRSVAGARDVNGDGRADLMVGAPLSKAGGADSGQVQVFSGANGNVLLTLIGQSGGHFGHSVAGPGDVDGNGTPDLIIGADEDDTNGPNAGAVWGFSGATGALLFGIIGQSGYFGSAVDGVADLNSDGRADFAAGARRGGSNTAGLVEVFALPGCPAPKTYCIGSPNSAGSGASIGHTGTTSIAANDLVLTATDCPPNMNALFYYGTLQAQAPLGNGFRCVGGLVWRLPPVTVGANGSATTLVDFNSLPPGGAIAAGDTRHFQLFYRDIAAGGAGFNFSNALTATFCP